MTNQQPMVDPYVHKTGRWQIEAMKKIAYRLMPGGGSFLDQRFTEICEKELGFKPDMATLTVLHPYSEFTKPGYPHTKENYYSFPVLILSVLLGDRCFSIIWDDQEHFLDNDMPDHLQGWD